MKSKIERNSLTCGCCGDYFLKWEGYTDQGQDTGYGICKSCQTDIADNDKQLMDKSIQLLTGAMNEKNKRHFISMPRIQQEYVVMMAIDNGIINFKIGVRQ